MKTIRVAHLYYDLMNLYGENGNIRFLKRVINDQGYDVKVTKLTIGDKIEFTNFDFFYIGCGNDENLMLVLKDMKKYKKAIKKSLDEGRFFLATGNSVELFGTVIFNEDNNSPGNLLPVEGLGIFNYHCPLEKERIVGEQYYETSCIKEKIIGFQNRNHSIEGCKDNLFTVINGNGYNTNENGFEGIHCNNFYGTYLLGPILVRNPYFTDYLVKNLFKKLKIKYTKPDYNLVWYKAYEEYLNNFYSEENKKGTE